MTTTEILLVLVCVLSLCVTRLYEVKLLIAHKTEIRIVQEQLNQSAQNDQIKEQHEAIEIEEEHRKEQAELYSSVVSAMQSFMLDTNVEEDKQ